ncbi:MAG: hypothetical protein ABJQ98_06995 [Alloalcanivorax venustensis]|jgi:hypothetical protein|uniref:hypothetical protein n=1 Tax=Alloalcanivorax venustensis TaxID=172371 RepID=UPI003296A15B
MRLIKQGALLACLIVGLAACGGDSDNDPVVNNNTNFTAFVKGLLDDDPNGEPANINNRNFRFTNQEDPDAYDDVLSSNN